jgi:hypothetical protein
MVWWDNPYFHKEPLDEDDQLACRGMLGVAMARLHWDCNNENIRKWRISEADIVRATPHRRHDPFFDLRRRNIPLEVLCMHDVYILRSCVGLNTPCFVNVTCGSLFTMNRWGEVTCYMGINSAAEETKFVELANNLKTFNQDVADALSMEPEVTGVRKTLLRRAAKRRYYDMVNVSYSDEEAINDGDLSNAELKQLIKEDDDRLEEHRPQKVMKLKAAKYERNSRRLRLRHEKKKLSDIEYKELRDELFEECYGCKLSFDLSN